MTMFLFNTFCNIGSMFSMVCRFFKKLIAMFYPRKVVMIALTFEGMVDHSIDTFCELEKHPSTGVIP